MGYARRVRALAVLPLLAVAGGVPLQHGGWEVRLRAEQFLYSLSAPRKPGAYRVRLRATEAPSICKLELDAPLAAGEYRLTIDSRIDDADRTFVFSIPVAGGAYRFLVTANGRARYDFVLEAGAGAESRAAFIAPQRDHLFTATLPPR
jgi:hypothetical protein